ncbi:MAG: hypothetical protein LBB14_03550 [Puniceicoccales bacterium]|jgi:hypothetical protein|nr:hypothetical protein [Puniceicoccales bacterium]
MDYIPILNLIHLNKFIPTGAAKIVMGIGVSYSALSLLVFILKVAGVGLAVLGGPIGTAVSLLAFAFVCVVTGYFVYKSLNSSDKLLSDTGYDANAKEIPPRGGESVPLASHKDDIRSCMLLYDSVPNFSESEFQSIVDAPESLSGRESPRREMSPTAEYSPSADEDPSAWQPARLGLEEAKGAVGAFVVGLAKVGLANTEYVQNGRGDRRWTFARPDLGVEIRVILDRDGRLFFRPHLDATTAQGKAAVMNNAIGFRLDLQTRIFRAAFHVVLRTLEVETNREVILTGEGADATYSQFLALLYGRTAYCINPFGIGATMQAIIGRSALARNADRVYHFDVKETLSLVRKVSDKLDIPLVVLLGFCSPGNFGHRYVTHAEEGESEFDALWRAIHLTAEWEKEIAELEPVELEEFSEEV